ncbi:MAG: hypothetical protein ACRD3Q_06620, partial [Terriglobales bacterium]
MLSFDFAWYDWWFRRVVAFFLVWARNGACGMKTTEDTEGAVFSHGFDKSRVPQNNATARGKG